MIIISILWMTDLLLLPDIQAVVHPTVCNGKMSVSPPIYRLKQRWHCTTESFLTVLTMLRILGILINSGKNKKATTYEMHLH